MMKLLINNSMTDIISNNQEIKEVLNRMMTDRKFRVELTRQSFTWFVRCYFSRYLFYPPAPIHQTMHQIIEDQESDMTIIISFRGSSKTTFFSQLYPIWAVVGCQQKKHVVLLGKTIIQAKQYLKNIRDEFENNDLLKNDHGPFKDDDYWNMESLIITDYEARIIAASSEQSIRGLKHGPHRPDLIILDDIEDLTSVKTRESRNAIYNWVTGDVIPLGDKLTKIIIVGNLLHKDSLLMRLINNIDEQKRTGKYYKFPLLDADNKIAWPGKYKDMEAINQEKLKIGDERTWRRECLLQIIPDQDQVITDDMIHHYDVSPQDPNNYQIIIGVDLAISLKESANKTAFVPILVNGFGKDLKLYVLSDVVNSKMTFPQIIERLKDLYNKYSAIAYTQVVIENNQFQQAAVDQLKSDGIYNVTGVRTSTDKLSRLMSCANLINQRVLFPRHGAEELISQLTGFGVERFDDLTDCITLAVRHITPMLEEDSFEVIDLGRLF